MARSNPTSGSTGYLINTSMPTLTSKWTMAGWALASVITGSVRQVAGMYGTPDDTTLEYFRIDINNADSKLRLVSRHGANTDTVSTPNTVTLNTYFNWVLVHASSTDKRLYLNNGTPAQSTSSTAEPSGLVTYKFGIHQTASTLIFRGSYAEYAVWDNYEFDSTDLTNFAAGYAPILIAPAKLVNWWKLLGTTDPEPDLIGSCPLTLAGTAPMTSGTHPSPIYYETLAITATDANKNEG